MEPLPKIPTPPKLVWREVRHRAFPGLVFALGLVLAVMLWRDQANIPHLVGEVEAVVSSVTTVEDGIVARLHVDRLDRVEKGQPMVEFRVADPDAVKVRLATLAAELKVMQTRLEQDQQRILQDYEGLRLSWLQERVALATAKVELQFAENELSRIAKLHADKLVSEDQFDLAKSLAESRRAEVTEREKLVNETRSSLDRLSPAESGRFQTSLNQQLSDEIAAEEERLRLANKPVTLRAPISGMVRAVYHHEGERVARGETILTITATTPGRIVGYLRQPISAPPKTGDPVEVRSRARHRQVGVATIIGIGRHFEKISANVIEANPGVSSMGLPVLVSVPENMTLLPGEVVDLFLAAQ